MLKYPVNTVWYIEARPWNGPRDEQAGFAQVDPVSRGSGVVVTFTKVMHDGEREPCSYILTCAHVVRDGSDRLLEDIICYPPGFGYVRTAENSRRCGTFPNAKARAATVSSYSPCGAVLGPRPDKLKNSLAYDWVLLEIDEPSFYLHQSVCAYKNGQSLNDGSLTLIGFPFGAGTLAEKRKAEAEGRVKDYPFWNDGQIVEPTTAMNFRLAKHAEVGMLNYEGPEASRPGMSGGGVFDNCGALIAVHRHSTDSTMKKGAILAEPIVRFLKDSHKMEFAPGNEVPQSLTQHAPSTDASRFTHTAKDRSKIPNNIPHLSPHFTERPALMEQIRCSFTIEGGDRRTRLTALKNYGGNGKTVAAILYAHQSVDSYPGGRFFLNLSEGGFAESFVHLATLLGIKTEEPTRTKDKSEDGKLVKTRLENGERSLLVLDNVDTLTNWKEIVASGLLPNTGCDVLITTRLDSIAHAAIVPVTRLDKVETLDVLSRFCRGAASKDKGGRTGPSESEAASIHSLLGGLALAIAAVGAFMKRNTHVSWEKYCQNLRDLPVDQLPDASEKVRAELGLEFDSLPENKRSLRVIDDTLDALVPREIRAIEYAALMAEDRVLRSWLEILIESDRSVDGGPVADSSDPTPEHARIVERLIDSDLLVALASTSVGPQLSLHRLFRLRVVERAESEGTLWDLVQGLAKFLDKKADSTYFDGYVCSMDLDELDNYPSLINRMVGLGMIDFAKQLAAKVFNQANAVFRKDELQQVFYKLIELIDMTPADSLTLADAAMLMRAAQDWHSHRDSQKSRRWAKQAYDICLSIGAQFPIQQAEIAYEYANILYKQDSPETAWQVLTDNLSKIWDEDHGPQDNLLREYVALALSVRPRSTPVDDNLIYSRAAQLEYQEYKGDADIKDFFSLASSVFFHSHQLVWAKAALSVQMAKFKHLIGVEDVEYAKFLYQMAYIETERGRHDIAQSHIKEAEEIGLAVATRLHEEDLRSGEPFPLYTYTQTWDRLDEAKINSVDQYLCKWLEYPNNLGIGCWFEWSSKLWRRNFLN